MAPQIAHKHHRRHSGWKAYSWLLGLMLSTYTIRLPFVGTSVLEVDRVSVQYVHARGLYRVCGHRVACGRVTSAVATV